jgi:hypothetical protein
MLDQGVNDFVTKADHLAWILLTGPPNLRDPKAALLLARTAINMDARAVHRRQQALRGGWGGKSVCWTAAH